MSYTKSDFKTCTPCKGNGHRTKDIRVNGSWITTEVQCTQCQGTGRVRKLRKRR